MAASEARPRSDAVGGRHWAHGSEQVVWALREAGPEGLLPLRGPFSTHPRLSVGGETIAAITMREDEAGL